MHHVLRLWAAIKFLFEFIVHLHPTFRWKNDELICHVGVGGKSGPSHITYCEGSFTL